MDNFQPYLDYFALHPNWALAVVFLVAMAEALLVIGLFVPSTVVLVGAGTLIGAGKLAFWPVMVATIIGAATGDQFSYWAGRIFGERLRNLWPLRNYPVLLAKGEAYVKEHGGKSIAIGRFIPGIKAVVPGIAGMFGMGQGFFFVVNFLSAIAWSVLHVLPGVILGQALSLVGEVSGRLLLVLVLLLGILAATGWLARLAAGGIAPYRRALQGRLADWANQSRFAWMRRLGTLIAPTNPNSILLLLLIALGFVALISLVDLVSGLLIRNAVGQFDQTLFNYFSELRSLPGDELFVRVTMLGDEFVLYAMLCVPLLWMVFIRNWRAAGAIVSTVAAAKLLLAGFSLALPAALAGGHSGDFRFPSGPVLMAAIAFGIIAAITARGLGRWSQAIIAASCTMIVFLIGFSRIYLAASWLSDVVGSLLIASILIVVFSVAIATLRFGHFRPLSLLACSILALTLATAVDVQNNFDRRVERYQPVDKTTSVSLAEYLGGGWTKMPGQRINFVGRPTDPFLMQWVGSVGALRTTLEGEDFHTWSRWTWRDALTYLKPDTALDAMSPNPRVHEGLRARLTATTVDPSHPGQRLVLRAFQSNTDVVENNASSKVLLISLTHERLTHDFGLFAVPTDEPPEAEEIAALLAKVAADSHVEKLGVTARDEAQVTILRPKS